MAEFMVAKGATCNQLKDLVNTFIEVGWEPIGSITIDQVNVIDICYRQGLVKYKEYKVISDDTLNGLRRQVEEAMREGWKPIGGFYVESDPTNGIRFFYQPVIH